ncbi:MAG: restriction endonuclease subunit S [Symploca sp. SIO3C6]|nr:restriction endonuclease subunit S [Symploca sp. SIO3C6]
MQQFRELVRLEKEILLNLGGWETLVNSILLKDLLVLTKDGEWGKGEPASDKVEMLVIRGADFPVVRYSNLSKVPIRYIPEKIAERKCLKANDILIETAGGTKGRPTGRTVFLKPRLFKQSKLPITCASFSRFLRVNTDIAEPEYIFWYFQFLYETGQMDQHQVQHTGIARFQYTKFAESLDIPLPPLPEQKAIANILGTLDDKIELNQQMNRTLEAIAQAIFKSWFVDFDPVYAKMDGRQPVGMDAATADLFPDEFEDSPLGMIPKGWRVGKLDNLLVLQRGFDLPKSQRIPGKYPVITASGSSDTHAEYKVKGPGVVTGRSGLLGKVFFVHENFWPLNTSLWIREFRTSRPLHAYHLLRGLEFETFNSGSAIPTLNRNHVHNLPVIVPPISIVEAFEDLVMPMFYKCRENYKQSRTLATIRDTLLPKLLSGEIRVKEAEKLAETVT